MPEQKHIDEIAGYLISFYDGTLKHHQQDYHSPCGTAHCLAGWKEIQDNHPNWTGDSWDYAQYSWRLTFDEACLLFLGGLTLAQMVSNLKDIAEDHGLTIPSDLDSLTF